MGFISLLICYASVLLVGVYGGHDGTKDVACDRGGKIWKHHVLNYGDISRFYTDFPYKNWMKCHGKYTLGENCARSVIQCYKFNTISTKDCRWGDYLAITDSQKTYKRFCQAKGPYNFYPVGDFKMRFISNGKKRAAGLDCYVACTMHKDAGKPVAWNLLPPENDCKCGMAKRSRIVGGGETEINEYPWQVLLLNHEFRPFCGGSLIGDQWVLTAASCVPTTEHKVLVGDHDFTDLTETQSFAMPIASTHMHPLYNPQIFNYDFALIKLGFRLNFTTIPGIKPICLPVDDKETYAGMTAIATGWGLTAEKGSWSVKLKEVELEVHSNKECNNMGWKIPEEMENPFGVERITPQMLCAGPVEGGAGTCQGDSGGPLQTQVPGMQNYVHIGVVSFGMECAAPNFPAVYARTTHELAWINDVTRGTFSTCPMQ